MGDSPVRASGPVPPASDTTDPTAGVRRLAIPAFLGIVVVYLAILEGLGVVLTRGLGADYAAPTTINELWRAITVPVAASLVVVYAVVAVLGWSRPVFVDHRPVRRWVRVITAIMVLTILLGTNYPGLADRGTTAESSTSVST